MGVVESIPHSESSSRTVASLNGSPSEAKLAKKPMENGECSYRPVPAKIKRRIVSAVRDFPPGCGRNVAFAGVSRNVPVGTGELEALVGASLMENSGAGNRIDDGNEVDDSDLMNLEIGETETALEDEIFDLRENGTADLAEQEISMVTNDEGQKIGNLILSDGQIGGDSDLMNMSVSIMETVESRTLEDDVSDLSKGPSLVSNRNYSSISVSNVNCHEKTAARSYPPRRHVSAVRDFPPFCGRNAAVEARNLGEEQSDLDGKPSSSNVNTVIQEAREDNVQEEDFQENKLGGNVSEVTEDGAQVECKGHAVEEMERKDQCTVSPRRNELNEVSEEKRKNEIALPQESNGYRGTREDTEYLEKVGKQIVVYREKNSLGGNSQESRVIVLGLMAASSSPWRKAKEPEKSNGVMSGRKRKKTDGISKSKQTPDLKGHLEGYKSTSVTKRHSNPQKMNGTRAIKTASQGASLQLIIRDEDVLPISSYTEVCPPPFGQSSSSNEVCDVGTIVTRNKVRETLRLFQAVSRKLLQEDEAMLKEKGTPRRRFDLQASKILKEKGKYVNVGKQILGAVPGVEVGDEFHYRVELNMIGLHRQIQGGIDYVKQGGKILATSIVASGGYADDLDNSNTMIYTGQGGNVNNTEKEPEDQKLERGNLALKNSQQEKNPVRVIRGSESSDGKARIYVYDGLYLVEKCWQDLGPHNKLVFKFQLDRIGGQPELAWKELKKSKKLQLREGICVDDISGGKESIPICAVNTIDDEKPPPFKYITRVVYPDWCRPLPLRGCSCTDGCSDSEICSCAVQNGGEIPYNFNGAIVEAKPLVYECGPSCECLPTCHNRVSQYGIRYQLEIFKTKSMGWGVRSLNSIPSGSFICEYIGELLEEKEAEARTGNDEYLFDIGNNYNDNSLWNGLSTLMPEVQSSSYEVLEEGSFTIDADQKGNLGRFINHSCSPNLYAQNVLYDHEDNRIPHIMFFAAENIPPLQELTYHYNYMIDTVHDSNGNIKKKNCYCGSPECTGRLY